MVNNFIGIEGKNVSQDIVIVKNLGWVGSDIVMDIGIDCEIVGDVDVKKLGGVL